MCNMVQAQIQSTHILLFEMEVLLLAPMLFAFIMMVQHMEKKLIIPLVPIMRNILSGWTETQKLKTDGAIL